MENLDQSPYIHIYIENLTPLKRRAWENAWGLGDMLKEKREFGSKAQVLNSWKVNSPHIVAPSLNPKDPINYLALRTPTKG